MKTHVQILAWLHILCGAFLLLIGIIVFLFFGGLTGLLRLASASAEAELIMVAPLVGLIGTILLVFMVVLAAPALIAGIGLLYYKNWARILAIVIAAISLLNVPLGTLFGIYSLWVLLHRETEQLFAASQMASPISEDGYG